MSGWVVYPFGVDKQEEQVSANYWGTYQLFTPPASSAYSRVSEIRIQAGSQRLTN